MKEQVSFGDFIDRFRSHDRQDQFTYDGKRALFDYLEEYEESCDTSIELDIIALCCEFTEYKTAMDWALEYNGTEYPLEACEAIGIDENVAMSDDASEIENAVLECLLNKTQVIQFDSGIIIQDF